MYSWKSLWLLEDVCCFCAMMIIFVWYVIKWVWPKRVEDWVAELDESKFNLEHVYEKKKRLIDSVLFTALPWRSQALSALLDSGSPKYKGIKCILQIKLCVTICYI